MQTNDFSEVLDVILRQDPRYHRRAYYFLREALDYTQKAVAKAAKGKARHVTGQELLAGVRALALEQFGPMTLFVLNEWGVRSGADIGELVFNLVDHKFLAKTDSDSRADFAGGFDFDAAFRQPFLPARNLKPSSVSDPNQV